MWRDTIPARRPFLAILLLSTLLFGCFRAEQVAADPDVFNELDALYTAVTSQRTELLQASTARLKSLHESGKLTDTGFEEISALIRPAEQGRWKESTENLYRFMRAQRKH